MSDESPLPSKLRPFVRSIGSPVRSEDVDTYGAYQAIADRSYKLRAVVGAWERQQNEDRRLRRAFAIWLLVALGLQVIVAVSVFLLIGAGRLVVDQWVASVFFGAVFAELGSLAIVVVKYLFPETGAQLLSVVDRL